MNRQSVNNFNDPNVIFSRVKEVVDKNKASDLFHKAFLRPQEIALKTWRTENDTSKPHDALPYGLKQVIKSDISQDKFVLKDFESFDALGPDQRNIQYINENNYDNLVSLLKPKSNEQRLQLCICICMYSEDKSMLRKTLAGVSNNIATFVQNGISADDIAVVIIMDGIEKVDSTVIDFFGEMEKESNIYLDDDVEPLEAREMAKDTFNEVDDEEVININNFLFDEIELNDRKKRRFAERRREYEEVKRMRKKIEKLEENKKITFEDLDVFLRPFFLSKALEFRKKDYAEQGFTSEKVSEEELLKEYADNVKRSRPIIAEALSEAKSYCEKYIQTRDSLALLNSYRVEVTFGSFENKKSKKEKYAELNEEEKNIPVIKMNLFFITKYKNSGKLSSHNWFFNGFCREIKAEFAVLLDVGLCPDKGSIYKMFSHMKKNDNCGGVCGYMNLRIERLEEEDEKHEKDIDGLSRFFLHFVDIQRAQQVEYHFSHLIDKPFEALFKFIHVLPGAFSAYRMKALQTSEVEDSKLMRDYFKSLDESTSQELKKSEFSNLKAFCKVVLPEFIFYCCYPLPKELNEEQLLYDSNVYLAEDRTLCMGIHQNGFDLDYLPDSHAWVDPIKNLHGLLGQRKRWINGSFFAFESVKNTMKTSAMNDCCLKLQIFYLTIMNMLAFVSPALFLFTIHIAMFAFRDWFFGDVLRAVNIASNFETTEFYNSFVFVMDFLYIMLMLGLVFKSMHMTHRTERFIPYIYICSTILGMFSIAVFIVLFVDMITGIIDSIQCFASGQGDDCSITFLAENPVLRENFFAALPGGVYTFIIYKWIVVGVISLYIIPISIYSIFFCKCEFVGDVLFGTVSFIFYTPTYLNILNTFALCRIDDISWGTKGLDAEDNKNRDLKESWKSIKILHVAKFIFWNLVVGAAMMIVSSPINLQGLITREEYNQLLVDSYVRKFFMTFGLMVIIGLALLIKIILGAAYSLGYRCTHKLSDKPDAKNGGFRNDSKVENYFGQVKGSMDEEMESYISKMVNDVKEKQVFAKDFGINNIASFIMVQKQIAGENGKKRAQDKWMKNVDNRSKVLKKENPVKKASFNGDRPISLIFNKEKANNEKIAQTSQNNLVVNPMNEMNKKKSISDQMNSEAEIKKSSDDLDREPFSINPDDKGKKKKFGIF